LNTKGETSTAMIKYSRSIALTVNGEEVREIVQARTSLIDFLRERLGLTGSHVGCEQGVCGACTVRLDGVTVRGCLVLAVQCAGSRVETIEGVSDSGEIADLQEAFVRRNALQCGFCTPGMLLSAQELLASRRAGGVPSRQAIRAHLSGNYCRCTGYQAIVDVVEAVARERASSPSPSSGRAGVGSFPRQGLAARAPTLPSPAGGGGQRRGP
jgi:aerobic carbon-monoxide dehydrogenase small subunit